MGVFSMAYLSYQEYTSYGGKAIESVFNKYEPIAERYLNYYTLDRLSTSAITDNVKQCLTQYVDILSDGAIVPSNLTSYSNGVESFGYSDDCNKKILKDLYNLAVVYLPIELVSIYVGD